LEANPFTGEVYAMIADGEGIYDAYDFYIYKIDVATAAEVKHFVSYDVGRPIDFTFIGETEIAIYDGYADYVYRSDISEMYAVATQLAHVQVTVASGDHFAMTYSKEYNRIFIATDDFVNNDGMALFKLNPANGIISKVADANYDAEMVSIFLLGNVTPATGVVTTAEVLAEEEVAETTEVVEEAEAEEETEVEATTEVVEEAEVEEETEVEATTEVVEEAEVEEEVTEATEVTE